jgi:DNA-binding transcriptional LysR family regulator
MERRDCFASPRTLLEKPAWPRPDGSPAPDGPLVEAIEDKNELVAAGQAVAIIPASLGTGSLRPDLTTVPLHGVEPSHVVLATRASDHNRLVAAFRKLVEAPPHRSRPAKSASVPPTRAGE